MAQIMLHAYTAVDSMPAATDALTTARKLLAAHTLQVDALAERHTDLLQAQLSSARLHTWRLPQRAAGWATVPTCGYRPQPSV